jgi:predicted alternative tryptophan synthase beta-subunit
MVVIPVDECAEEEKKKDGNDMNVSLAQQLLLREMVEMTFGIIPDVVHLLLMEFLRPNGLFKACSLFTHLVRSEMTNLPAVRYATIQAQCSKAGAMTVTPLWTG